MIKLSGLGVAMVTPFNANGQVDYPALQRLTEHIVESSDFLVVMGTTGETPTLSFEEQRSVLDFVIEINNKRVPVVMGLGGNNTAALCERIKEFDFKGVDAVLSASPYYNKPSQEGIYQHFMAVANASPKPIILYNVPSRTGSNMTAATTVRLSEHKNIIAVKEASGDLAQIDEIIRTKPADFSVLSGDDGLTLAMLGSGADGVISVIGNALPKRFGGMIHQALFGQVLEAKEMHHKLAPIIDSIFEEGNPAGIKSVLDILNICSDNVRLPLVPATKNLRDKLYSCLADLDVDLA